MRNQDYSILIRELKAGKESAFDSLFRLFYQDLCRFACSFLNDPMMAEDVVQGIFEKIWTRKKFIDESQQLDHYLYVSVRNACYTFLKNKLKKEENQEWYFVVRFLAATGARVSELIQMKVEHVQIGYFAQNQAQLLDGELTVFDTIDRVAKGDIRLKIRDILGAFMFGGEASEKKVKVLSGGERSRLAMIKLLLEPVNFLILDEPTNHLDMRSKDVLKDAIRDFDGTVVVVSHDREFLDGLVSKVYEFGGGLVKEHLGGIYDFLQRKNIESLNDLQKPSLSTSSTMVSSVEEKTGASNRLSYEQQKEQQKKIRRLEKAVEQCEARIGELEAAVKMLEDQLATPEGAADVSIYERHGALKKQLDEAVNAWEEASLELEEAQS